MATAFFLEAKSFTSSWRSKGLLKDLKVHEFYKGRQSWIFIPEDAINWIRSITVKAVSFLGKKPQKWTQRFSQIVLLIEMCSNLNGVYLKFSRFEHDSRLSFICIPNGKC